MSKEDIEALTLQDYEKLEKERMEKNVWKAAGELAQRVDGEPAPHVFISCTVTPRGYGTKSIWVPMLPSKQSLQRRSFQAMATIQRLTVFLPRQLLKRGTIHRDFEGCLLRIWQWMLHVLQWMKWTSNRLFPKAISWLQQKRAPVHGCQQNATQWDRWKIMRDWWLPTPSTNL